MAQSDIVTPVLVDRLLLFLHGYDTSSIQYLHNGFTKGFKTGFKGTHFPYIAPNPPDSTLYSLHLQQYISTGMRNGQIAGPFQKPPHPNFRSSPIFLREKRTPGKYRCIHNLSYPYNEFSINSSIPDSIKSVQYASIKNAIDSIQTMGRYTYMCKLDVKQAFRIVPVAVSEQHLLGFSFQQEGKTYYAYDRVLPMGMGTSCAIWEKFASALEWVIREKFKIVIHHILDDFILFEESYPRCKKALELVLCFFDFIGVPVEPSKTEGPTQCLTFVGVELDTVHMQSRLPLSKVSECLSMIDSFLSVNKVTLKQIQVLTGKLCFATCTLPLARPFLRRLYDLTSGLSKPFYHRRLTVDTKCDLLVWKQFLLDYNGKQFIGNLPVFPAFLASDASSLIGYGAVCGPHWVYGTWPDEWQADPLKFNIDVKELYAVFACLATFSTLLSGYRVFFYCDNLPVVSVANRLTSKSKNLMPLVRDMALLCMKNNISLEAIHISSSDNFICDKISRGLHTTSFLQAYGMDPHPTPVQKSHLPDNYNMHKQY